MIKIIKGIYGYKDTNGAITPKTSKDEPFILTDEQEARLVKRGVAEYVQVPVKEEKGEETKIPSKEIKTDSGIKAEVEAMDYNDLKKLAKELGIPASGKKDELVEKILAVKADTKHQKDTSVNDEPKQEVAPVQQSGEGNEEADTEEPPKLMAEDPQ